MGIKEAVEYISAEKKKLEERLDVHTKAAQELNSQLTLLYAIEQKLGGSE